VVHDWGSGLGFHWATLNPENIESITHMESLVGPIATWNDFPSPANKFFQAMRSSEGK